MNDLLIRNATPADADRACEIAVAAWEPIYAGYRKAAGEKAFSLMFPQAHRAKAPQIRGAIEPLNSNAVITECDGEVVAFATYNIDAGGKVGQIGNNAVAPAFQGRGIGSAQLQVVVQRLRELGAKVVTLMTGLDDGHTAARAMYERAGFRQWWQSVTYIQELPNEAAASAPTGPGLIRTGTSDDADAVVALAITAWEPVFEEFRRRAGDAAYDLMFPRGARCKDESVRPTFVAHPERSIVTEVDGSIAGFATSYQVGPGVGEVGNNAVYPDFQGRGVGVAQMYEVLRRLTADGCLLAKVLTGLDIAHAPARAMYERVGFRQWWPSVTYIREF